MRYASFSAFAVLALLGFQDPVNVNPKMVSVAYENDHVRVLRVHSGPHERLETHSHPALVVVSLTAGSRRVYAPDGSYHDTNVQAGDVRWREPSIHAVENLADEPFENIEIEFKKAAEPAVAIAPSEDPSSPAESSSPVPLTQEPHHHVMFENQYVRVLDVNISPGESTLFHTHGHDNLSVRISGGFTQSQVQGKDWRQASQVERGTVVFSEGSTKPYTHRIRNLGTGVYRVIDIELLR